MRVREKLTVEEKVSLALELIKRERSLDEIRRHYRVSHTTAYKIRKTFLEGGRAALENQRQGRPRRDLEARVAALEHHLQESFRDRPHNGRGRRRPARVARRADNGREALT